MANSGTILLTSTGLSSKKVYDVFENEVKTKKYLRVVIITTASLRKEKDQYSQLAFSQLKLAGVEIVDFYDFENDGYRDLSSYDIFYVCGGNTFKLMKFSCEMNFKKNIDSLLERGGMYIGVSAGSLIIGPSIKIASEVHPDKNDVEFNSFNGFNIVDLTIFPHYSSELEDEIKTFENKNDVEIRRIDNSQGILIKNGEDTLI